MTQPTPLQKSRRIFKVGGGVDVTNNKRKRSRGGNDGAPARRKKHCSLPTFASYEDYARVIEDGPEENL